MPHLLRVEKMVIHDHEKVSFLPVFANWHCYLNPVVMKGALYFNQRILNQFNLNSNSNEF